MGLTKKETFWFIAVGSLCVIVIAIMGFAMVYAMRHDDPDLLSLAGLGLVMAVAAPFAVYRLWRREIRDQQFYSPGNKERHATSPRS